MDRHQPEPQTAAEPTARLATEQTAEPISARYERTRTPNRLLTKLAVIGAIGVAALTLTACGEDVNAVGPEPTISNSAEPTVTPSPENTQEPHKWTDQEITDLMNEPIPDSLKKYESMPVSEFESLPVEERLSYCSYLNRDQEFLEGEWYKIYKDPKYLIPENLSKGSSAQDILGNSAYTNMSAFTAHFGGFSYDRATAQKLLACTFYTADQNKPVYHHWTEERDKPIDIVPPGLIYKNGGGLNIGDVVSDDAGQIVKASDGREVFVRGITATDNEGSTYVSNFAHVEYKDYRGNNRETYVYYEQ